MLHRVQLQERADSMSCQEVAWLGSAALAHSKTLCMFISISTWVLLQPAMLVPAQHYRLCCRVWRLAVLALTGVLPRGSHVAGSAGCFFLLTLAGGAVLLCCYCDHQSRHKPNPVACCMVMAALSGPCVQVCRMTHPDTAGGCH
jgi:hypothetical protein